MNKKQRRAFHYEMKDKRKQKLLKHPFHGAVLDATKIRDHKNRLWKTDWLYNSKQTFFESMIEYVKYGHPIISYEHECDMDPTHFLEVASKAEILVFHLDEEKETKESNRVTIEYETHLDLPYEVNSLELSNLCLAMTGVGDPTSVDRIDDLDVPGSIQCCLAIDNHEYMEVYLFMKAKVDYAYPPESYFSQFPLGILHVTSRDDPYAWSMAQGYLTQILSNLPEAIEGSERTKRMIKVGKKKDKKLIKIKRVIHMVPRKIYKKDPSKISVPRGTEFSHAFLRRGHWRKLNEKQLGKDRQGHYRVKGKTWVNQSVVGAKSDKELIHKVRYINGQKETTDSTSQVG